MMCESSESISAAKRKRKHLLLNVKREIVDKKENGASASDLMKMYNIGRSTLYDVLSSKTTISERSQLRNRKRSSCKKLFCQPSVILDENLHDWFVANCSKGIEVSEPMVVAKAKQLNEDLKLNLSCTFNVGWLQSFKERYGIKGLNIAGERKSANPHAAAQNQASFQSVLLEHGPTGDKVYNANETGINWKCLSNKTLAKCGEKQVTGIKHNREHLTVFLCGNSLGKHENTEEITWESVEKAIEYVIQFMERKSIFDNEDSMPARWLQQCLATKKLEEIKQEDMRKKIKEVMNDKTDQ